MAMLKITNRSVEALKPTQKEAFYWDSDLTGFGVRIYPSGRKTYVVRIWLADRTRPQVLETIGSTILLDAQEARDEARLRLRDAAIEPDDCSQERSILFAELSKRYLRDYAKLRKRSWKADEQRAYKYLLPALGEKPIAQITRANIAALHNDIGRRFPYAANRCKEQLSKMFELARTWLLLPETHANPAKGVSDFPEQKKTRWLRSEEVTRLSQAVNLEPDPYVRAFVYLLLLTSLRKTELISIKWSDLHGSTLEVKNRKNNQPILIPLNMQALQILAKLPRQNDNPHVFVGSRPGAHLYDCKRAWHRIRHRANLEDVRLHDLRHTVAAWLAQSGESLHLIGKVLGHKSRESTAVYAHLVDDNARAALEKHGSTISDFFASNDNLLHQ